MESLSEPTLHASAVNDSMHAQLRAAREASPTAIDATSGAVVVLRYHEVERLAHDTTMVGAGLTIFDLLGIGEGPLRRWYGSLMFTNEGDVHHRLRRLVARVFTPRAVERHRALAAELARTALTTIADDGGGDLVAAFAEVPIRVICRLLGVPEDEISRFVRYADALSPVFGLMDADQIAAAADAVVDLAPEVEGMIADRAGERGEDLISALVEAESEGDRFTHDEVVTIVGNLIVGGHDTTASQVGCTLLTLLRNPSALEELRTRGVETAHVVSETIRYEPSLGLVPRTATEPVVVGGIERPAGSMIWLATASANRDAAVWGDAESVRPGRFAAPDAPRLLSFGSGPHYCLGAALARMTLEEVVTGFASVADRICAADDLDAVEWRSVLGRSPARLPVLL
jgi:cytochrome P450